MSIQQCLATATADNHITQKQYDEAVQLLDDIKEEYRAEGHSEAMTDLAAAKALKKRTKENNAVKKRQALATMRVRKRIAQNLREYRTASGEENWNKAAIALFDHSDFAPYGNFEKRRERILGLLHGKIESVLDKFAPKYAGTVRPKAGTENILKELYEIDTGDVAAKEMAEALGAMAELARKRANLAGADIRQRTSGGGWRAPQQLSSKGVRKWGQEKFVEDMEDRVDWRTVGEEHGYLNENGVRVFREVPKELREEALKDAWVTIKTEGMNKADPLKTFGASVATRVSNHRYFTYKTADDWLYINERYGEGNVFDQFVAHAESMSRDIAMMEKFGPNPASTVEWLKKVVMEHAASRDAVNVEPESTLLLKDTESGVTENITKKIDSLYNIITFSKGASAQNPWANGFAGTRNILVSAKMGGAYLLAAPTDFFTKAMMHRFNRTKGVLSLTQYLKMMNPASSADRRLAVRSGLIASSATNIAMGHQRFFGEMFGPQMTRRISDVVLRLSLLTPHTQAARWATGMELMGNFGDNAGKRFNDLPFVEMLKRHGITEDDWNVMRQVQLFDNNGSKFLRPNDLLDDARFGEIRRNDVADKFQELIMTEIDFAVPSASLRSRAALISDTMPGTLPGELARSAAMFKSFPVTIALFHGMRGMLKTTAGGKASYYAQLGVGMTVMGALGVQMREIAAGRDPMDMTEARFWGKAALAGGGLSIWGDFLFSNVNRYGGGLTETAAGPVVQFINETRNLTWGNLEEMIEGKDTNFGREMLRWGKNHGPGSNLWWSKLVLQRMVIEQLQKEIDPKAMRQHRRAVNRLRRETGQGMWWQHGDFTPRRAPQLPR